MKVKTLDEIAVEHPELAAEVETSKKLHAEKNATPTEVAPTPLDDDAAAFVLSFGTPDEAQVEEIEFNGRAFFVKVHTGKESVLLGSQKWRDKNGKLIEKADDAIDNHIIVTIWQSIVRLEEQEGRAVTVPLFTREQVEAMYQGLPKARAAIDTFWDETVRVNPNLALKNA